MKKVISICLSLLVLLVSFSGLTVHAAGSLSANASSTSVIVNNTVTLTLTYNGDGAPIAAIDAFVHYNVSTFQFISCSGAEFNPNAAGVIQISYYPPPSGIASETVTIKLTFKAITPGSSNFSITTTEFVNDATGKDFDNKPSRQITVSATNPTLSNNNNLSSLRPSSGTLTPAFKAGTTSYTISVPYTTTSLSLSAVAAANGATVSISGNNSLAVGKNTRVITVTAPNGDPKKYTVVITRAQQPVTTPDPGPSTPPDDPTPPESDPLEVEVNGVIMTIADTQPAVDIPQGFSWNSTTINDINVSTAVNETAGVTLVYLTIPNDQLGNFYIYDASAGKFYPFCPLTSGGGSYILREMPLDQAAPAGTIAGKKTFGDIERDVFLYTDSTLSDLALVYATSPAGNTALYTYDETDGSMQLYRAIVTAAGTVIDSQPTTDGTFFGFIMQNQSVFLIIAAVLGGLALLIASIILLIFFVRRDKTVGKH